MIYRLISAHLLILTFALGSAPARPGVIPSDKVKQQLNIMSPSYTQGGLASKLQRVKTANNQSAENGLRDLREDVYMSFPVIMGSYIDAHDDTNDVNLLQRELFDGPWPTITMAEHYEQMSYGQFHLSGTVFGWYELSENGFHYGGVDNGWDGGVGDFLRESLDLADLEIDFTQYDNDGPDGLANSGDDDGYVDAAFFVHSGPGGEGGGAYIWSHRWVYSGASGTGSSYVTNDTGFNGQSIRVNDYIIQPAVSVSNGGLIEIGVFSHEFGHALGLPDLYDTDYTSDGVGDWCLMAGGTWSSPSSPTHMSAWCKEMLGWTIPTIPNQNIVNFEFPNAEENAFAVKLWTRGELDPFIGHYSGGQDVGREYYLIENRQRIGSERHLPGTGLIIWHIDNSITNNDNENHRMVDVIAADGFFNRSNSADPWPGSSNNRNFDFETIPPAIGWDGENTEVAILNISDSDSTMTARVEVHESTPHLSIIDMVIDEANQDNIFTPGEAIEIWLVIKNLGATVNNLIATLSIPGGGVDIVNESIDFDPINYLGMGMSNLGFELIISDTISPQASIFEITLTGDELLEPDHHELVFMLGLPQVALIDDDGANSGDDDFLAYYQDALLSAGVVSVVWNIVEEGIPSLEWLQNNPQVIWFTGNNEAPLDDLRINLITSYLNGGGQLLLSGQDVATDQENVQDLLSQYFAAERRPEAINSIYVYGDPSHDMMSAEDRFTVSSATGAANQTSQDAFNVLEGGSSLFIYPFSNNSTAGISNKTATYSSIILGFGLEALSPYDGDAVFIRGEIIRRMLDWLDTPTVSVIEEASLLPGTASITSAYPNPFNPSVNLNVHMLTGENGQIQILDLRGAVVEILEVNSSGLYKWHPSARHAGGVYFMRLLINGETAGQLKKLTYLK